MPEIFGINQTIRAKYELVYRPRTPSRTAPTASCGSPWSTTKASRCASRTRNTSRSSTTSSPATATAPNRKSSRISQFHSFTVSVNRTFSLIYCLSHVWDGPISQFHLRFSIFAVRPIFCSPGIRTGSEAKLGFPARRLLLGANTRSARSLLSATATVMSLVLLMVCPIR